MNPPYYYQNIPPSRIATFDVFSVGLWKHHVYALLEFDVTDSRRKLQELRRNGTITSVGMIGRINGWFIHKSVHPISFGIGSVLKKPVVIDNEIRIREVLNMTILIDHDVIDGGEMVRFLQDLTKYIEGGKVIKADLIN